MCVNVRGIGSGGGGGGGSAPLATVRLIMQKFVAPPPRNSCNFDIRSAPKKTGYTR